MRPAEVEYWDKQAAGRFVGGAISDNWMKRQVMMAFFCKYNWLKQSVLEIGVGAGVSAAMLKISCGGLWKYIGTDVSPEFCKAAKEAWRLNVVQGDVLSLPEGKFSRILALDSLEHVRPEDRPKGYDNIADRLEENGALFINIPLTKSLHDEEFDYGFDLGDLKMLEERGLSLETYDTYVCHYVDEVRKYAMAILSK